MTNASKSAPNWRSTHKGVAVATPCLAGGPPPPAAAPNASAGSANTRATTHRAASNGASGFTRSTVSSAGLSNPATIKPAPTHATNLPRKLLPELRPNSGSPDARARNAPSARSAAKASRLQAASSARMLANFDGVDAIENERAAGYNVEPPDEGLGAGHGYVANFVNVTGAVYNTTGTMVAGPFDLNSFFKEPYAANTSDPRVYYDASTKRWFATILVYNFNKDFTAIAESHIDLAVSRTGNPAGRWKVYKFDASDADPQNHAGCPCLADYPILGIDQYNVYISTNEFTSDLNTFNGTQLYALSKSQLVARQPAVNMVQFENLSVAGTLAYHVQPANTYGPASAEWMMSSLDPNSTYDNRLAVWALTQRESVTTGNGNPGLSVRVISSEAYSFPPEAETPPGYCTGCKARTSGIIDNDFDAMQEVEYINGQLVGALDTGVTIPGDTAERSGVAWFVVHPSQTRQQVDSATHVIRQGYVASQGLYLLYPHVNMTENGAMAMTFGFGGPATYLSAGYSVAAPGGGFGGIHRAAAGTGPDDGFTGTKKYGPIARWGDYSNGEIIPGTNRVWLATQYIPNSGTEFANWGNRIFELKLLG
jgi:hypothetical protein